MNIPIRILANTIQGELRAAGIVPTEVVISGSNGSSLGLSLKDGETEITFRSHVEQGLSLPVYFHFFNSEGHSKRVVLDNCCGVVGEDNERAS